ncbi:TIGR04283 family arsenosugar biosynthesis glycosyltransferase [Alkalimarinus alittae]|uniref:TIGR04283 family arsenosugar biosynthesis glycosyltransferase n=1 Tax=Alkalimarinus alittae TaxID=2961619 RepID=A0ABY6N6A2_9ALTE|nr:TIGR04283 family arsenosugar biosynthesis glycosyltransferase [Alkalimarinus alittae]UZE97545.1 TIGR04283 family arsenosugar biosynthesis glycosyltransferase [Alkalimarinus alittae]
MQLRISIIIPTLNEEKTIKKSLKALQLLRLYGAEVIVADGGSRDNTKSECNHLVDCWVDAPKGRATQMNAGADVARFTAMLFLHADTVLPGNSVNLLKAFIESTSIWGRFNVRLSGDKKMYRVVESMMNWRSMLTGIATGDQAIFVRKAYFERVGRFPQQPLMEDVALTQKLKKISRPYCIKIPVTTDSRRWEKHGVWKTILLMWSLRFKYMLGVDVEKLHRQYYP